MNNKYEIWNEHHTPAGNVISENSSIIFEENFEKISPFDTVTADNKIINFFHIKGSVIKKNDKSQYEILSPFGNITISLNQFFKNEQEISEKSQIGYTVENEDIVRLVFPKVNDEINIILYNYVSGKDEMSKYQDVQETIQKEEEQPNTFDVKNLYIYGFKIKRIKNIYRYNSPVITVRRPKYTLVAEKRDSGFSWGGTLYWIIIYLAFRIAKPEYRVNIDIGFGVFSLICFISIFSIKVVKIFKYKTLLEIPRHLEKIEFRFFI